MKHLLKRLLKPFKKLIKISTGTGRDDGITTFFENDNYMSIKQISVLENIEDTLSITKNEVMKNIKRWGRDMELESIKKKLVTESEGGIDGAVMVALNARLDALQEDQVAADRAARKAMDTEINQQERKKKEITRLKNIVVIS